MDGREIGIGVFSGAYQVRKKFYPKVFLRY